MYISVNVYVMCIYIFHSAQKDNIGDFSDLKLHQKKITYIYVKRLNDRLLKIFLNDTYSLFKVLKDEENYQKEKIK